MELRSLTPAQTIKKLGFAQAKEYINEGISIGGSMPGAEEELQRLIQSYDIVQARNGLDVCRDILSSVESTESEYGSRLGTEYKKSSNIPEDKGLMLCDDGSWCTCLHLNSEFENSSRFLNIKRLMQAVLDVEHCENTVV